MKNVSDSMKKYAEAMARECIDKKIPIEECLKFLLNTYAEVLFPDYSVETEQILIETGGKKEDEEVTRKKQEEKDKKQESQDEQIYRKELEKKVTFYMIECYRETQYEELATSKTKIRQCVAILNNIHKTNDYSQDSLMNTLKEEKIPGRSLWPNLMYSLGMYIYAFFTVNAGKKVEENANFMSRWRDIKKALSNHPELFELDIDD